ncbi:radical SAM protein [Desulfopila sp. IMCC35006]|uniref:radical SAM protein n=1 Tax=Desulfopila sp. IMCC35006 TaxID=2569542 RepID=UPI0010AC71E4|nr:radical SAM protein [Desulfopila sp. IMCC35006]TKB24417.1 radical SAM protein [Desulfopila sp. IMCC35006]
MTTSSYLAAARSGLLAERIEASRRLLADCSLCPRRCKVDRLQGQLGLCRTGVKAEIASYGPHFGEEAVLVGEHGSGTIFFCGCSLLCVFCQNYDISHPDHMHESGCLAVDDRQLAEVMVELQAQGCHNINLVTPSHVVPQILAALPFAVAGGLRVPLIYNSSGYDSVAALSLLDGIVDIYMPDCKFWSADSARRYAKAADYPEVARMALQEMQRQVGDLQINGQGLAEHGLLVRHLLMPGGGAETDGILRFLAEQISVNCYVNIMDQYRPCGRADAFVELGSAVSAKEYRQAMQRAEAYGLTRLDRRDLARLLHHVLDK